MTSWRKHLEAEMTHQDDPGPVVAYHPDEAAFEVEARREWDLPLDAAAWTDSRVYFAVSLDWESREIVSAPRNPPSGVAL